MRGRHPIKLRNILLTLLAELRFEVKINLGAWAQGVAKKLGLWRELENDSDAECGWLTDSAVTHCTFSHAWHLTAPPVTERCYFRRQTALYIAVTAADVNYTQPARSVPCLQTAVYQR